MGEYGVSGPTSLAGVLQVLNLELGMLNSADNVDLEERLVPFSFQDEVKVADGGRLQRAGGTTSPTMAAR